ncbi:MAG: sensor histidine kinase [Geitlerinemataceae cyanobacterium]
MNSSAESHVPDSSYPYDLSVLGTDLAFVQTCQGRYAAFHWKQADRYDISPTPIESVSEWFRPCDLQAYKQLLSTVFREGFPQRSVVSFTCQNYVLSFDLTLTPIADSTATIDRILAMGRLLPRANADGERELRTLGGYAVSGSAVNLGSNGNLLSRVSYPRFLTHIARKIRQTLDFETVWAQAAEGLNEAFNLAACHIFTFSPDAEQLQCIASLGDIDPVLVDDALPLADWPDFAHAIERLTPTIVTLKRGELRSRFAIATSHQGIANGVIVLDREISRTPRRKSTPTPPQTPWFPIEIEIIEEIANQVGTAAAHATLYRELEAARVQAEELSQLKSEFLANTSHELRTPLNGMMGFLKLILDGMADNPEEQTEFIEEAYRSAVHLLNIINDILDVAKIESGKMELDFELVKLSELFEHVRDFTQSQIHSKGLSLEITMPRTDDEIILYGNYQRLLQVLLNLVGNAIKFTHEGGITVSCEILKRPVTVDGKDLPATLKVLVSDTGIGIALDKQDRLFESFSQVDGSRTRTYGGTGLGLMISQKLIEMMGGKVNFFSMGEGLGSTVTFTAPLFHEPVIVSAAQSVADILVAKESGEDTDLPFDRNGRISVPDAVSEIASELETQAQAALDADLALGLDTDLDLEDISSSNLDSETLKLAAELNVTEDGDLAS